MEKLIFGTTNQGKLEEARSILKCEVEGIEIKVDEIQSLDPFEVALKKAQGYYSQLKKPLFIEDVSLSFDALGGLPGTYINDFHKILGNQGLTDLLRNYSNKRAEARTVIVYIDDKSNHIFEGLVKGSISSTPKGEGFGWDPIFIPEGEDRTFGEIKLAEKNKYSMRAIALKKMYEWLEGLTDYELAS